MQDPAGEAVGGGGLGGGGRGAGGGGGGVRGVPGGELHARPPEVDAAGGVGDPGRGVDGDVGGGDAELDEGEGSAWGFFGFVGGGEMDRMGSTHFFGSAPEAGDDEAGHAQREGGLGAAVGADDLGAGGRGGGGGDGHCACVCGGGCRARGWMAVGGFGDAKAASEGGTGENNSHRGEEASARLRDLSISEGARHALLLIVNLFCAVLGKESLRSVSNPVLTESPSRQHIYRRPVPCTTRFQKR